MSLRRIAGRALRAADRVDRLPRAERRLGQLEELARLRDVVDGAVQEQIMSMQADGVPVQVLAARVGLTRQALHKRLRTARAKSGAS